MPAPPQLRIIDYADPAAPRTLYQDFDEAWYLVDSGGTVRVILRRDLPSREVPGESITQIVRLEAFWKPIPGLTNAESSMLNATITYLIRSGPYGVVYRGNGFVSFQEDRRAGTLTGMLEAGRLEPSAALGEPPAPFGPSRIEGAFSARQDLRRATTLLNQLDLTVTAFTPVVR